MKNILYILFLFTLAACSKMKEYKAVPYVTEVEDKGNGLRQEKKFEEQGIRFEVQFRPAAYSALKELGAENFNPEEWQKLKKEYKFMLPEDIELIYKDKQFGLNDIKFRFEKSTIQKFTQVNIYTL